MEFKFNVGDMVLATAAKHLYLVEMEMNKSQIEKHMWEPPEVNVVLERKSQECPGGTQLFYLCRLWAGPREPSTTIITFHEIELEEWSVIAWLEEWQKLVDSAERAKEPSA